MESTEQNKSFRKVLHILFCSLKFFLLPKFPTFQAWVDRAQELSWLSKHLCDIKFYKPFVTELNLTIMTHLITAEYPIYIYQYMANRTTSSKWCDAMRKYIWKILGFIFRSRGNYYLRTALKSEIWFFTKKCAKWTNCQWFCLGMSLM